MVKGGGKSKRKTYKRKTYKKKTYKKKTLKSKKKKSLKGGLRRLLENKRNEYETGKKKYALDLESILTEMQSADGEGEAQLVGRQKKLNSKIGKDKLNLTI